METSNIFKKLQKIAANDGAVYLKKPLSTDELKSLGDELRQRLGEEIPLGYRSLLAQTNGVQINNAYINEGKTFLEENIQLRTPPSPYADYLALGYQGNVDRYVFNKRKGRFEVTNFFHPNEVFETFESLEALLAYLLKSQDVQTEAS